VLGDDRDGKLVMIPQFPFEQPVPDAKARSFRTNARYVVVRTLPPGQRWRSRPSSQSTSRRLRAPSKEMP
jgi:hypothetical protein